MTASDVNVSSTPPSQRDDHAVVADIMTRNVVTVPPEMKLEDLQRLLLDRGLSGAPVAQRGTLLGVISRTDVLRQVLMGQALADVFWPDYYHDISGLQLPMLRPPWEEVQSAAVNDAVHSRLSSLTVRHAMTTAVIAVSAQAPAGSAGQVMLDYHIHRVLVTEDDRLVGIVSALDLVTYYVNRGC